MDRTSEKRNKWNKEGFYLS